MQRTGNHLLATLCIAFLLFIATTCTAFANSYQECYIERDSEGDYMMVIPTGTYSVPTRLNSTVTELADATWDVPIVLRGKASVVKTSLMEMQLYTFLTPPVAMICLAIQQKMVLFY